MRFCDQKCFLESPLVVSFYFIGLASLTYMLVYAALAANFGSWSHTENMTYYLSLAVNVFFFSVIFWVIYFFHKHDRSYYTQRRFIVVNIILILVTLLGIGCIYCYIYQPTKTEVQRFLHARYTYFGSVRSIFTELETELKCCGINDYTDYILFEPSNPHQLFDLPSSCCIKITENCGRNIPSLSANYSRLHRHGCIQKEDLSDIKSTKVYKKLQRVKLFAIFPMLFTVATIIIIQIILCMTRHKEKLEINPTRVGSWENRPREVQIVFRSPGKPDDPDGVGDDLRGQTSSIDSITAELSRYTITNLRGGDNGK